MSKRRIYKITVFVLDAIVFVLVSFLASFLANGFDFDEVRKNFVIFALLYASLHLIVQLVVGNYNILWMYRTRRNYLRLGFAFLITYFVIGVSYCIMYVNHFVPVSLGTCCASFFILFTYLVASRYTLTLFMENVYRKITKATHRERTLIVGAGSCGSMILSEIGLNKELPYDVVGFLDDSNDKVGSKVNNVKVYGPIENINEIIDRLMIKEVIIAIPSAGSAKTKEIMNSINYKHISVHIVPGATALLEGSISKSLRKVSISDLLGREAVKLDSSGLNQFLSGKTVLVTGGGGSIGSEICRQVLQYNPKIVIIFDIYENTTYELITELDLFYKQHSDIEKPHYIALIGSVRDISRLDEVFSKYKPNIVFHAAAHKHVPLMEDSPKETIKNNIKGTYNVCKMADKYRVEKMVMISTDKAVNPTNIMGASKRFCELIVEAWNEYSKNTNYSMVRFGNVLGSHGSVIPLFEKQIQAGGPVTVTDERINRFFMTIPEACSLVIQSGAYAAGGEKFILDMGQPVKIIDLAKKMIQLSGLELGNDINIEITGLRPGEKLYEELLLDYSNSEKTKNEKIFVERAKNPFSLNAIDEMIITLEDIAKSEENVKILDYLKKIEKEKLEEIQVVDSNLENQKVNINA